MAGACQLSAVGAAAMVALVLAAAIATLTSVILAQQPPTPGPDNGTVPIMVPGGLRDHLLLLTTPASEPREARNDLTLASATAGSRATTTTTTTSSSTTSSSSSPPSPLQASSRTVSGRNCYRKCVAGDNRVCHFHFDVHAYQTMSRACYGCPHNATHCSRPDCVVGDGVMRKILAINKQMPGPPIQVCVGDTVVVNVKNSLNSEGLTIHWHGLTMRGPTTPSGTPLPGTPHMDGTPGITQCPIQPGTSFRYSFYASNAGTHFYHSHTGFQRGDGVFGPLIVRQPSADDPNQDTFDYDLPEHVLLFHDWLHIPTEDKFLFRHHSGADDFPKSMLVNGQGPFQYAPHGSLESIVPYRRFKVTQGNRYRMRLINTAILNCPIVVAIDQHTMTVIESDGNPVVPRNVSSLVVYPGERWDVILHANHRKPGTFWISLMGGVDCAVIDPAHQYAFLQYEEQGPLFKGSQDMDDLSLQRNMALKPRYTEVPPPGVQVNSINRGCTKDEVCVADLRSPHPLPEDARTPRANFTFYLAFEMRRIHNALFYSRAYYNFDLMDEEQQIPTPQINNLTFLHPPTPLLLGGVGPEDQVCNAELPLEGRSCHDDYCECLHMYTIPLGSTVDLVLIDEGQYGDENHPIHLHGEYFWVLGQDRPNDVPDANITRSQVIEMDERGLLKRNLDHPPYKDTVTIPDGGYSVVRFRANNPGYWLLHCHLLFHSMAGMNMVFKIGEDHHIPSPPPGFPTCGNFKSPDL